MKKLTIKDYKENFDSILKRVENGEKIFVTNGKDGAILESDDFVKIHTELNNDAP